MILGIALNSRTLGLALLKDEALIDYKVKLFKERWSPEKLTRFLSCIESHVKDHAVKEVALLHPTKHHHTSECRELIEQIKRFCRNNKLPVCSYKVHQLHTLCENARAKKKALMQALSLLYPELSLAQRKELRNRKRYYFKLFEAVGAALLHTREKQLIE
jgi:hypothetical protein